MVQDRLCYFYLYIDLGQLIREDNREKNKSYVYEYDDAGNIKSIKTYDFTTGTLGTLRNTQSFTYQSSGWRDLLLRVGKRSNKLNTRLNDKRNCTYYCRKDTIDDFGDCRHNGFYDLG